MRSMPQRDRIDGTERPRLAAKARVHTDRLTGQRVLLYPEGVLVLNATATAVLDVCDGRHTLAAIVAELAEPYAVACEVLSEDIAEFLERLQERGLLWLSTEEGVAT